jgi:hypothetical protein
MVKLLGTLGYHASVRVFRDNEDYFEPRQFQLAFPGWAADFPSASDYIVPLITCVASAHGNLVAAFL